jgi:BolA family transcriptional regulator, general stress-responsive regulator
MSNDRVSKIRIRLEAAFAPQTLEIIDDSHKHAGHAGAADGRGHFKVRIVSEQFHRLDRLQRHRMVYEALGDLMKTDIHAVQVTALTPDQTEAK